MIDIFLIILEQSMIYLPLVLGAYISFSLLKIPDLSLETSYLIGAFAGGCALQLSDAISNLNIFFVLGAAIAGGLLVGAVVSSFTYFAGISHLLSSIITFGLFQGLFLMLSSPYVSLAKYNNIFMVYPYFDKHPELFALLIINLVICVIFAYLLKTQLGYSFAIFGCNSDFFSHFKISKGYVFITGVLLAHGLAGLAGFYFAQTNSLVELNMGVGKALFCITALILGKAIYAPDDKGHASLFVPLSGVICYFALQQGLLQIGFNLKYFTMIQALLVFVVVISVYKKNYQTTDQLGL
ncbi:MAG: ABC transporter permease subunit [Candidatus Chromulinivorax sp.]